MLKQLIYHGPEYEVLHTAYAKAGRIDAQAPITSSNSIMINAPVGRVWALLIDLPAWPGIASAFRNVYLETELAVDAYLRFELNAIPIRSRFAVVNPERELTWTGRALWFNAVDRITLNTVADNQTQLSIAESFAGLFATALLSSATVQRQHEAWLQAFKRAAEAS